MGIASGTGSFSSSAITNDVVIRATSTGSNMMLQTGSGAASIFINSSNNVGIGASGPTAPLQVNGSTSTYGMFRLVNSTATTTNEVSMAYFNNPSASYGGSTGSAWCHGIAAFGTGGNNFGLGCVNTGIVMSMLSSGSVGIGTTNPSYKLDVLGDARATGSLIIGTGGTYTPGCIFANGDWAMILRAYTASPNINKFLVSDNADTHLFGVDLNNRLYISQTLRGSAVTRNTGICRLTINSDYNDANTGFGINASDGSIDDYTMKLYPYVVAGGVVGYAFGTLNASTNYTPLSFNRNLVGINNTSPGSSLSVLGGQIMVETSTTNNAAEYVSPTPGIHIRGNGQNGTAQMIFECQGVMTSGIACNSAGINIQAQSGASVLLKYGVAYNGDYSGGSTGLQVNGSGVVLKPSQPYVSLGAGGTDASVPYNYQGACFGYSGFTAYLTPYQSVGFTNTTGNGWVAAYGTFTAPWTGRYQVNITFYWNSFTAGNRWSITTYNSSGTLLQMKYCCLEGGGFAADTTRPYGTTLYMSAGDYFQITLSSYGGGSCNAYFGGITHSSMTIVFLG
jgi:hypothetical protein